MTATFTITGDLRSAIGDTAASRSVYAVLSTTVRNVTEDITYKFGARGAASNGVFTLEDIPAWDPLNLPYDAVDAPFSVTVQTGLGDVLAVIPAQVDGATVDIADFSGPWSGPPAPTNSGIVDGIAAALVGGTSATSAALRAVFGAGLGSNVKSPKFLCNSSDERATLQAAIAAVVAGGGAGAIIINGRVSFATPLDLTGLTACAFIGVSAGYAIGCVQQAALIYTGTGSSTAIDAQGRKGITFQNLNITYTGASFTGILLDLGGTGGTDGSQHTFKDCLIRPTGSVNTHACLVDLDQTTGVEFHTTMLLGDKAVRGKANNGSYSNAVKFFGGYIQGVTTDPIWNPGEGWKFDGVIVEATPTTRLPKFIGHDAGVDAHGLVFDTCWVGDDNAAGAWVKISGYGFHITGGLWTVIASGGSIIAFDGSTAAAGLVVEGASLSIHTSGFVVDLSGFSGASAPLYLGVNGYTNNPTSLVNGTIPNGSYIVPAGNTAPTHYSRLSEERWLGDASTRSLIGFGVTGGADDRFRIRADGLLQWLDSGASFGTGIGINANGVLAAATKATVMDVVNLSTLASNGAVAIDARTCNVYWLTLNANLTSSTLTNGSLIQEVEIHMIQDGTGGRTYVWPTTCKFAGGSAPSDTTANTRTIVRFRFSGSTNWHEVSRSVAVPN